MIDTNIVERFADGQNIITEGIVSTKAYIITSGQVKVTKKVGDKQIVIGNLKEGDIFGEMGLLGEINRTASVTAIGDVNLGVIDKELFDKFINTVPEEAQLIFRALIERLKITTTKLASLAIQFEKVKKSMNSLSTKTFD